MFSFTQKKGEEVEISKEVREEFTKEILSFKDSCGLSDADMAALHLGAAARFCVNAGLSKWQARSIFLTCYKYCLQHLF